MHVVEDTLVGAVIGSVSILPTNAVGGLPFKAIAVTIVDNDDEPALTYQNYKFLQTEELTAVGIAVHPYGAIICNIEITSELASNDEKIIVEFDGKQYGAYFAEIMEAASGDPITFALIEDEGGGSN